MGDTGSPAPQFALGQKPYIRNTKLFLIHRVQWDAVKLTAKPCRLNGVELVSQSNLKGFAVHLFARSCRVQDKASWCRSSCSAHSYSVLMPMHQSRLWLSFLHQCLQTFTDKNSLSEDSIQSFRWKKTDERQTVTAVLCPWVAHSAL